MQYEIIRPCELLKDFISHFWVGTWDVNSQRVNSTHYIIASSLTEITFAFKENKKYSELLFTTVQGQTYEPNQYAVDEYYHLLGVSFYSHAIPYLFNIPSTELNNEYLSLDTFLGQDARILTETIAVAATTEQRVRILSEYFINSLKKRKFEDGLILNAIEYIRKRNGDVKITEIASDFGLSQKQFNRRFKVFTGFSPKLYSRIIRFESVIKSHSNAQNLTDLAHLNNYYDQAHFIHEFKSFVGFTPKDFWKLSDE